MRARPLTDFSRRHIPSRLKPLVALVAIAAASLVQAAPQGGVVQAGSATITKTSPVRTDIVQTSDRAVINWQSFSIGAGERVNFQQPSASSAILNRVVGVDPSVILGRLTANGQVFIVNPNGVFFGQNSRLDVGSLVATTANISNSNFMAGRLAFDDVINRRATVINEGMITAADGGLVALIAPGVSNQGVIRANLGRVALASGNAFTLDLYGDKLVSFAVDDRVADRLTDATGRPLRAFVDQTGTIEADGGSVILTANAAKSVLDNVINMSGVIRAQAVTQRGGEIVLHAVDGDVRVSGLLDASGAGDAQHGGNVSVLGGEVVIASGAQLDASGGAGGGKVMVGGDFYGAGSVARANNTTIESGSVIAANATSRGAGGEIAIWSDGHTQFDGHVAARGASGDGGFIEVSGKNTLGFTGTVDLSRAGTLLLDPTDLTIDAATANAIMTTLRSGANSTNTGAGNITVSSVIDGRSGTAGGALTLSGAGNVAINKDIYTNNGAVSISTTGGTLSMAATGGGAATPTTIHAGNAAITLSASGAVTTQHLVTTGAVSVTSTAGAVTLAQGLGGSLGTGLGSLAVSATGNVGLKAIKSAGNVNVATGTADITLDGAIDSGGNITLGNSAGSGGAANTNILLRNSLFASSGGITLNGVGKVNPAGSEILFNKRAGGTEFYQTDVTNGVTTTADAKLIASGLDSTTFNGSNNNVTLWDGVTAVVTLRSGSGGVTANGGLVWDGATPVNSLHYFKGFELNLTRANVTAAPTRHFEVAIDTTGTVTLGGTLGFTATGNGLYTTRSTTNLYQDNPSYTIAKANAQGATNPPTGANEGNFPLASNTFELYVKIPAATTVSGGTATGSVDRLTVNVGGAETTLSNGNKAGNGFGGLNADSFQYTGTVALPTGGQFNTPSPNNVASTATFLSEIALPGVVALASNASTASAVSSTASSTASSTSATVANASQGSTSSTSSAGSSASSGTTTSSATSSAASGATSTASAGDSTGSGAGSGNAAQGGSTTVVVGGRGVSQSADLGRNGASGGAPADVFLQNNHVVSGQGSGDNSYFAQSPFQQAAARGSGDDR